MRGSRQARGFTLIEVLVAVAISSLVLAVAYGSFFQVIKSKEFAEESLELYSEARVALGMISRDLAMAFLRGSVYPGSQGIQPPYFEGSESGSGEKTLRMVTFTYGPVAGGAGVDQTEVEYATRLDRESGLFVLVRRENPFMDEESGWIEYPLSERVVAFDLSYLPSAGAGELVTEWDSAVAGALPAAVVVKLVLRSPRGDDVPFSTTVALPAALER